MNNDILINLGLSNEEAEIYLALLDKGELSAGELAKSTKVKRTYIYSVAAGLIKKGLISQTKKGKATVFVPLSPDKLLTLAEEKKQKAAQAEQTLEAILPTIKQKYLSIESKPLISSYEGISGLKKVYRDVLETKENILLFRSIYDDKRTDIDGVVTKQIEDQVKLGIETKTITPLESATKETFLNIDPERLVERRIVTTNFNLPAQIIIYGSKIALISLKKEIVATTIDNEDITESFKQIFNLLWQLSEGEHKEIISKW